MLCPVLFLLITKHRPSGTHEKEAHITHERGTSIRPFPIFRFGVWCDFALDLYAICSLEPESNLRGEFSATGLGPLRVRVCASVLPEMHKRIARGKKQNRRAFRELGDRSFGASPASGFRLGWHWHIFLNRTKSDDFLKRMADNFAGGANADASARCRFYWSRISEVPR